MEFYTPWTIEREHADFRIRDATGKHIISVPFSRWEGDKKSEREAYNLAEMVARLPSLHRHLRGVASALALGEERT